MYDVITFGAATRDVFLRSPVFRAVPDRQSPTGQAMRIPLGSKLPVEEITFETGGGATNTAVAFARLRLKVAFVGKLGLRDARGEEILRALADEDVDTRLAVRDARRATAYSVLLVTPRGERTALVYRGASAALTTADLPTRARARWFYLTSLSGNVRLARRIFDLAAAHRTRVAWNPGAAELAAGWQRLAPLLKRAHVLLLNREEATQLTGRPYRDDHGMFDRLCFFVPGVVVVTEGKKGALVCHDGRRYATVPHDVPVRNTTGAGDAFGAGFVAGQLLRPDDLPFALQLATAEAESVIQSYGAKAGLLHRVPPARSRCRVVSSQFPSATRRR